MFITGYNSVASIIDPRTKFHFVPGDSQSRKAAEQQATEHATARKAQIAKWLGRPATDSELAMGRIDHADTRTIVEKMTDDAFEVVTRDSRTHKLDNLIEQLTPVTDKAYAERDPNKRLALFAKQIRDRDHGAEDDAETLAAHLETVAPLVAEVESLRERLNWTPGATVSDLLECDKALAQLRDPDGCPEASAAAVAGLRASEQQRHAAALTAANERLAAATAEAARVASLGGADAGQN